MKGTSRSIMSYERDIMDYNELWKGHHTVYERDYHTVYDIRDYHMSLWKGHHTVIMNYERDITQYNELWKGHHGQ